jgi:integrase
MLILIRARKEEIGQLKWSEIEGNQIHLSNGRTKNGEAHIIALSKPAQAILKRIDRVGEYVFNPAPSWWRVKPSIDDASGVSGWVIHDLRRTLATGMQKLRIELQVTEAVLNHKSGSRAGIVGVYQVHQYADEKREALERWG